MVSGHLVMFCSWLLPAFPLEKPLVISLLDVMTVCGYNGSSRSRVALATLIQPPAVCGTCGG